jgi:hypothetical protein
MMACPRELLHDKEIHIYHFTIDVGAQEEAMLLGLQHTLQSL